MSDNHEKKPIEYRNYVDDRPQRRQKIGAVITGMAAGIFTASLLGCLNSMAIAGPHPDASWGRSLSSVLFGGAAVVTGVVGIALLRGQTRRLTLAGFLLGVALASIIEGICFLG